MTSAPISDIPAPDTPAPGSEPDPETPDVLRRGLRLLGSAIREQPRIFAIAVLGSSVYAAMTIATAVVFGRITSEVILPAFERGEVTRGALLAAAGAIVGVSVVKAVGITARRIGAGVMQYRLQAAYRRRVTRQYLRLPLAWHARHPTGELLSNANADVEAMWWPIAPLPFAVGSLVMLVGSTAALFVTDWVLALVAVVVFPAVFAVNVVYSRVMSPRMTRAQQLRADVSGVAHESFDGALVVKTLGREASETDRFGVKADELRDAMVRVGRVRGVFDPVIESLPELGVLLVLVVGAARLDSGAVTVGDLVQVAYLFTLLAFPIRALGWVLIDLPRAVVGSDRVRAVLDARGGMAHGSSALPGAGSAAALEVSAVRFGYDDADAPVLTDVSFDAAPGRTVAVVGPTGAGKSTLAGLLVRLVDPDAGSVRLDGVDLRAVEPGGVAAVAALVPQSAFLFDDTVRGNVALGLDVPDERIWAALRTAQADGFVAALPGGLDTLVGERGTTLSGGQRQRVALARALVRRPRLLVLDDATSAVDPSVEQAILAGLREAASTVVVIAYRRATIALADEVVYVEHGRVRARGPHADLLDTVPAYRRLVTAYERQPAVAA